MSCEFLSAPGPRRVSRARRLSDALLSGELGDRLSVPLVSRTRRLSDALLQVVPNFPSSYHSPVSKLAKVLSRNKSQNNGQPFTFTNTEWLEASFQKRECVKIIPSSKDSNRCCCGLPIHAHSIPLMVPVPANARDGTCTPIDLIANPTEHWNPSKHTVPLPTDAYGCIDFRGGTQTNKAQYIRLSHDTRPELVLTLLLREWGLEKPKLLITVNGGKANFELQPKLKKSLRKGLLKAAKTTGAWIFTGGTNTGVTKHVGDALVTEKSPRIKGGRVVSIGITPWGIIEKRNDLVGKKMDIPFHSMSAPRSRLVGLNKHHAYFLMVDNGTTGKYGAEIALRRKLEKFISTQRLSANFYTPLVCLVIEGGTNTIRAVLEYVTDTPPVPVVVCDGTGRAADLIAFAHKYAVEDGGPGPLDDMQEQIIQTIQKTFNVAPELAVKLHGELIQCVKRKHLITVFRVSGERVDDELDQVIMTALFKARHLSPVEQLSLALTWNRCDVARKEIFVYGQEWPTGSLDQAMLEALENDRVDFVRLLLENGVNMNKFLTIVNLETLYNSKKGPANTLEYLVRDVVPKMPKNYQYSLIDIGLVVNQLIGHGFRSSYTRRKFRYRYDVSKGQGQTSPMKPKATVKMRALHKTSTDISFKIPTFSLPASTMESPEHHQDDFRTSGGCFDYPFSELIIWAVLTKRKEMAKLMWRHGEQALSKALVASRLCQAMANEAADDDLDVEIYDELTNFGKEFESLAVDLLDYCYHLDDDLTQHLLTAALDNWSRKTCLSLAVIAKNLSFLAHPISQAILADLWMGGLRMRKNPVFKIIIGLFFPPSIAKLEFKTREELELMPQTEEELHAIEMLGTEEFLSMFQWFMKDREDSDSNSSNSSNATSRRSSFHAPPVIDIDSDSSLELGRFRAKSDTIRREILESMSNGGQNLAINSPQSSQNSPVEDESATEDNKEETEVCLNDYGTTTFKIDNPTVRKKTRPLRLKKKLYEFYAAPITKYYCHSIAYAIFLVVYTYICLVRTPKFPNIPEWYVAACQVCFGCEKIRTFLITEPVELRLKLDVWISETKWNVFDSVAVFFYLMTFAVRFDPVNVPYVHAAYSTIICYWYIRSLKLIGVNKYFGPYVMMIGQMIENMIYFIVLLLVVLMAFGVCRQSILYPNEEFHWRLVRHIFYQPYFMLYGEVFAPDIEPECNEDCLEYGECGTAIDGSLLVPCHTGRWITPIIMTVYLLVANILLINLLIASFNTIYNKVSAMSQQLFNFQRFAIVMEYEEKPILPAPFILISHFHLLGKYIYRRAKGRNTRFETGLKLFLSRFDMERLYDFEEEGVEGLMRTKDEEAQQNLSTKVRNLVEMADDIKFKTDDIHRWRGDMQDSSANIDFRLQRLEEIAEQTANQLTVIHRFMTTTDINPDEFESNGSSPSRPSSTVPGERQPGILELKGIGERSKSMSKSERGDVSPMDEHHIDRQDTMESEPLEYADMTPKDELKAIEKTAKAMIDQPPPRPQESPTRKSSIISGRRVKLRHLSSGASSIDGQKIVRENSSKKKRRSRRRKATESSEEDAAAAGPRIPLIGSLDQQHVSEEDAEALGVKSNLVLNPVTDEEFLDEADDQLLGDLAYTSRSPFLRSQSEVVPTLSRLTSAEGARSSCNDESDENNSMKRFGRAYSTKSRRRAVSNRDYTSITDELECLIAESPNQETSSSPPPGIKIETDNLRDAEEVDYILMESLINRRLRRDSTNLQASLEDLVTKSIRDPDSKVPSVVPSPAEERAATSSKREGTVRIRLGSDTDQVEVEFIDEVGSEAKPEMVPDSPSSPKDGDAHC
ncbi:transient receptor potential cation channel trpm-like isoform X3 [Tigriopus californicus]|uniref:transient receptor potential cation channel trpm-like isoform X3 n=1 Tax=Tigriopus californicus TaxID=6832 RepID=UPI0027DA38FB|nr:transient receptor potential cation channel trpm-like isoform X3 [Tigriopus californicus]